MKAVELLKIGNDLLKTMSRLDVFRDDYKYVSLHEKYYRMRENGVKHMVAVQILSEDYNISMRTVERVIKRLNRVC